ncbi:MAG: undecaprenyl-diphosphate phosphatase [Candidatus Vogelbacteria bacterium]|nr:undecaprenyl-diphosphate phosphatase [Candidatus Vogelbacteria bacterium]
MTIISSIVLGIIEGVTEFLPISSTGHMILVSGLLKLSQTDFLKSFEIIIQLGAILAVVALYWRKFTNWEVLKKVIVAFIPTGIIGLIVYKILKQYLLGNSWVVLEALFLGGIILIIFEIWLKKKELGGETSKLGGIEKISYRQAVGLGLFQSVAIIPGVSRSAATIIGGLALKIKREIIVEFSFLLAVPTMMAATGLDLLKNSSSFSVSEIGLLLTGFCVSFIVAILAIRFFIAYIQKHNFIAFGIYRIALAIIFAGWLWFVT